MADNHFKIHKGVTLAPQSAEPSNPVNGDIYYDSSLDKFRKYENGVWTDLGSGDGAGGINYVENPDFENNALNWNIYRDAAQATPEDGTGGVANSTFFRVDTADQVIRGEWSGLFNQTSGTDYQGTGLTTDMVIDPADRNKKLQVSFDYAISDTRSFGDYQVFVYDIDNATLIGNVVNDDDGQLFPGGFNQSTLEIERADVFVGEFQATDSLNYRFIVHRTDADTATNSRVYIDNVRVGPVILLPAVFQKSEIIDLTGVGAYTGGSIQVERVGDIVAITILETLTFPSNSGASSGAGAIPDWAWPEDTFVAENVVSYNSTRVFRMDVFSDGTFNLSINDWTGSLANATSLNRGSISYPVPGTASIVSNNKLTQQSIKSQIFLSADQSVNTTASVKVAYDTAKYDPFSIYDSLNNSLEIPRTGFYRIDMLNNVASMNADEQFISRISVNGSEVSRSVDRAATLDFALNISRTFYLQKGDVVTAEVSSTADTSYTVRGQANGNDSYLQIESIPDFTSYGVLNPNTEVMGVIKETNTALGPSNLDQWYIPDSSFRLDLTPGEWDIDFNIRFDAVTDTGSVIGFVGLGTSATPGTDIFTARTTAYALGSNSNTRRTTVDGSHRGFVITENTSVYVNLRAGNINTATTLDQLNLDAATGFPSVIFARRVK